MSSAITLHSQGEQIRDAVKKMDMLHSDLEVGENIVNDMESWFGYWKISHKKQSVISGQEFSILAAKTQQESHIPSKIILASNSINIYSLKDKELFSFGTNDIGNTLVHSPFEVTFVQRRIGKPDIKAHVVSTELPNLLRCLEKLYKKKLSYEKPQFSSDDEDDENDKEDGYAESYLASSSSKREQLFGRILPQICQFSHSVSRFSEFLYFGIAYSNTYSSKEYQKIPLNMRIQISSVTNCLGYGHMTTADFFFIKPALV